MDREWDTKEAIRRWDKHAAEFAEGYTAEGDLLRRVVLNAALFDLLGPVRGKRILDAGCGEGYLSRLLVERGASVVALDYSREMLKIAKDRTSPHLAVEFKHGSCEDLGFLEPCSFDLVVSNVVFQDFAGYEAALRQVNRVLVPGGPFILSILHPCFSTPGSGWVRNERGEKQYWKVDHYFREGPFEQPGPAGPDQPMLQFHRPLSSYFRAITEAGFAVEALAEPKPSEEMLLQYPEFRHDLRMCHFLIFKARKELA